MQASLAAMDREDSGNAQGSAQGSEQTESGAADSGPFAGKRVAVLQATKQDAISIRERDRSLGGPPIHPCAYELCRSAEHQKFGRALQVCMSCGFSSVEARGTTVLVQSDVQREQIPAPPLVHRGVHDAASQPVLGAGREADRAHRRRHLPLLCRRHLVPQLQGELLHSISCLSAGWRQCMCRHAVQATASQAALLLWSVTARWQASQADGPCSKLPNFHTLPQVEPVLTVSVVVGRLGPTVSLLQTRVRRSPAAAWHCKPEPFHTSEQCCSCCCAHAVVSAATSLQNDGAVQLEGSRAVRNISDRFTATMTNRVRCHRKAAAQCRDAATVVLHSSVRASKQGRRCVLHYTSVLRPVPHFPLQVRWRDAAEDAAPDSQNGFDASSATVSEQQGSGPGTGGSSQYQS